MAHQLRAATVVRFLATNVLLLGVLGIDQDLGAAAAGFTHTDSAGGVTVNVTYLHPQNTDDMKVKIMSRLKLIAKEADTTVNSR